MLVEWLADTFLRRSLRLRHEEILVRSPIYCLGGPYFVHTQYQLGQVGSAGETRDWSGCLLSVEQDGLHLYPRTRQMDVHIHLGREALRWFGRPQKYQPDVNHIWLHFESGRQWHLLQVRTRRYPMQGLVRALKQIATPEQVKAYRRHRPYMHHGPTPAQTAQQNLHGAWQVDPLLLALYLMPSHLVVLQDDQVQTTWPLEIIQNIEVMRRIDDPAAGGVVRFKIEDTEHSEPTAFTLLDYGPFGAALAEAAKRSLEDPPLFYGKKKDDDEDEWDE